MFPYILKRKSLVSKYDYEVHKIIKNYITVLKL